jgi:hypothetical protein
MKNLFETCKLMYSNFSKQIKNKWMSQWKQKLI